MAFCHPFDDLAIVAGQATLGVELLDDIPDLRRVIIPLGGGGLAAGAAIALKTLKDPSIRVVGVQVEACAPYAEPAGAGRRVVTLADGIAVKQPGARSPRPLIDAVGRRHRRRSTRRPSPTRW